jgi:hypothetical protein
MRKFFAMLAVVLAIAALSTGVALGSPHGTDRPLKGSGSAVNTFAVNGTFVGEGSAQITHLGRSSVHIEGVLTGATTSAFTTTVVAANGDTLTTSGTGALTGPSTFANLETITGGTGRFAGASGTFTDTGTFVLDPSNPNRVSLTFTLTGTISY